MYIYFLFPIYSAFYIFLLLFDRLFMVNGSLMAHGSKLKAYGLWPRGPAQHPGPGARRAWAMSHEPGALSHEP